MSGPLQEFPPLAPAVDAALRASIERFGVIVPVVHDQHGRIIDGHHRTRIATDLGIKFRIDVKHVHDDKEARALARTLNADRRHLTEEQRKEVVALLAAETTTVVSGEGQEEEVAKHSPQAIAGALGVSEKTVRDDIAQLRTTTKLSRPGKTLGQDGKVRPTRREPTSTPQKGRQGRPSRKPLPDLAKEYGWALRRDVERIEKLLADDRFGLHKEKVAAHLSGHLTHAIETFAGLLDRLNTQEESTA